MFALGPNDLPKILISKACRKTRTNVGMEVICALSESVSEAGQLDIVYRPKTSRLNELVKVEITGRYRE